MIRLKIKELELRGQALEHKLSANEPTVDYVKIDDVFGLNIPDSKNMTFRVEVPYLVSVQADLRADSEDHAVRKALQMSAPQYVNATDSYGFPLREKQSACFIAI